MQEVTSKDGTKIAFDKFGKGPAIILVDGALEYRAFDQGMVQLADLLAQHFTVFHYDRPVEETAPIHNHMRSNAKLKTWKLSSTKRVDLLSYMVSPQAQPSLWKQQLSLVTRLGN